ncbi:MAG: DNA internalization-related competence protein ComEC/Rec2 [Deltaproteobacteria bacterium]|nr:DNA internalization-related competence protein ComEC/Rec2 [Deltaproteobacteria bacterium]
MSRPVVFLLTALSIGIFFGQAISVCNIVLLSLLFITMIFLLVSLIYGKTNCSFMFIVLSFFFLGALLINRYLYPPPRVTDLDNYRVEREKIVLEGIVDEPPRFMENGTVLIIQASGILRENRFQRVKGKIRLSVANNTYPFRYGDYIRVFTTLRIPRNFNNPGGFDYRRHLLYQEIRFQASVSRPSDITVLRRNRGNILRSIIENYRTSLSDMIQDALQQPEQGILRALTLGDRSGISQEMYEMFSNAGVSHILAISGLHVGIIASLFFFGLQGLMKQWPCLLLRFDIQRFCAFPCAFVIIGYFCITGCGISTFRATIMILTFLLSFYVGRDRDPVNTIALAAFIILLIDPPALFAVSFQLSFAAVTAIVVIMPLLNSLFPMDVTATAGRYGRIRRSFILFSMVTLCATIGTAPLTAFYFNKISLITLVANIIVVPLIGFAALPLAMLFIIIAPVSSGIALFFLGLASLITKFTVSIITLLAGIPRSVLMVATPSPAVIVLYYLSVAAAIPVLRRKKERRPVHAGLAAALCLLVLTTFAAAGFPHLRRYFRHDLAITCIDVGQGSSALLQFPGGGTMLVDGGGFYSRHFDVGRYAVSPFLRHEGINRLDIVVLTHPDCDHLGGLPYILKHFSIGEVWTNGDGTDTEQYREFRRIMTARNIPHRIMHAGSVPVTIGDSFISVLSPPPPDSEIGRNFFPGDTNNRGLVLKVFHRGRSILLPADIGEPAEKRLVDTGCDLESTVILVPHHGCPTSSNRFFLEHVRPRFALCSCGYFNTFGFPHADVLLRYREAGAGFFRTDLDGAVTVTINEEEITVRCHGVPDQ